MAARKKVVIITTVHRPYDHRIYHKEAMALCAAGYHVVLIARPPAPPTGPVTYVPLRERSNRLHRATLSVAEALLKALKERADVYHYHDSELIPVSLFLRALTRAKVVYDVHEDLPRQVLRKDYLPRWARRSVALVADVIDRIGGAVASAVVVAQPSFSVRYPKGKATVVQNFLQLEEVVPSASPYASRPNRVVYIGLIDRHRGIHDLVRAMTLVTDRPTLELAIAGDARGSGTAELAAALGVRERVSLVGWLSRLDVQRLLSTSRVGAVTLHPVPGYLDAFPVKLFEYMGAGLPVVASDFPLYRHIVGACDAGILVNPQDPAAIAQAIDWLLDHPAEAEAMGARGRAAVTERYAWSGEERKLVELYARLTRRPAI